ncbi:hypothetical protein X975_08741, partial [Stegodyphus mimosarum]
HLARKYTLNYHRSGGNLEKIQDLWDVSNLILAQQDLTCMISS